MGFAGGKDLDLDQAVWALLLMQHKVSRMHLVGVRLEAASLRPRPQPAHQSFVGSLSFLYRRPNLDAIVRIVLRLELPQLYLRSRIRFGLR